MRLSLIFLVAAIFLVSCLDEFQKDLDRIAKPDWNPQVGIPFLNGSFTMEDYVDATSDDITVTQSAEGVVIIEYSGEPVTSDYAEDLIEVPTQTFNKSMTLPVGPATTGTVNFTQNFDSDINPEPGSTDVIDSVYLKAGTLTLQIETNVPADGVIGLTINSLDKEGTAITYSAGWTYDAGNPEQNILEDIDLAATFGDFTKNGTAINNFNFDAEATLTLIGQPLAPTHYLRVNIEITNPKFQLVYGKFSEREFTTELETVGLGIFDSVAIEGFYLDQPSVEFNFSSSYGVPVEANILTLEAINSNNEVLPFSGSAISNPTQVSGPAIDEVGSSVETSLVIDKTNSNITEVISFLPSELNYQFSGKVLSPDPNTSQFVLDTSRVIGDYKVVLPLDGRVARFESEHTVSMGGGDQEIDFIDEAQLIVKSTNGLPVKVGLEITFLDEFDNEIITLFKDKTVLEPGEIDTDGFVVNPTENTLEETLTGEEATRMLSASRAIIKTVLNTGENGTEIVKFRMTDNVSISLYLQTSLKF